MQETLKPQPYAWAIEEFDINGKLVWSSITQFRPTELSWIRDLPTKKHYLTLTPLFKDEAQAEKITGIKSYKESTKRLSEAYGGL